jgi:hypothetical protein
VLAAAAALPDAEADDEAEADEADAAEAEDLEAVAEAEDEADEPEGQLGLVLRLTPEPLQREVARVMVLSVSAWLQLLRTQQEILEMFSSLQMQPMSMALQVPILLL